MGFKLLCAFKWDILKYKSLRYQLMQHFAWEFAEIAFHKFISVLVGEKGDHLLRFLFIERVDSFEVLFHVCFQIPFISVVILINQSSVVRRSLLLSGSIVHAKSVLPQVSLFNF